MWVFWLIAFLWAAVGGILWWRTTTINVWEWLAGSAVAFVMAAVFQYAAVKGMTTDTETWSGQLVEARYIPAWLEHYAYYVAVPTGSGKTRSVRMERRTATTWHSEWWRLTDTLGGEHSVSAAKYNEIVASFGGAIKKVLGTRTTFAMESRMLSGDPMDYVTTNATGIVEPVTTWKFWENRVKACPSVFSFPRVPKEVEVFDYPKNDDVFHSDRLLGTANTVSLRAWDQMNARLGSVMGANVILIGFGNRGQEMSLWQRAKWIGGKKNDLVLCYGGGTSTAPAWTEVFGWTQSELCKSNLRTLLLQSRIDSTIVPKIESEIRRNYVKRDWHQFDYLTVEPPTWSFFVFFFVVGIVQGGLYLWFANNEYDQDGEENASRFQRGRSYSRNEWQ